MWRAWRSSYRCSRVQLFLLPLEHHVVHLVFLKLLLAAVQQQLAEVDGADRQVFGGLVGDGHFELDRRRETGDQQTQVKDDYYSQSRKASLPHTSRKICRWKNSVLLSTDRL